MEETLLGVLFLCKEGENMSNSKKNIDDRMPWDRQEGETAKAFEAFQIYRDIGPERSQRKVCQKLSKNTRTIADWSSKNNWVERCEKYDVYIDSETQKQKRKDILAMRERHAQTGMDLLAKAAKALQKIPDESIKASEIAKMIDVGVKIERLSRGESTENVDAKTELTGKDGGPVEVAKVTFYIPDNGRDEKEG
jgi:hypothetical protein